MGFITDILNDLPYGVEVLVKLIFCFLSGGLIGLERGRHGRSAGFRTHILVCLGATLAAMTDLHIHHLLGSDGTRIAAQVVTGIGFLGAGVILIKRDFTVTGLTTAAGMWTTSIIGLAYGYGFFEAAILATVLLLLTTMLLFRVESGQKSVLTYYMEVDELTCTNAVIDKLRQMYPMGHLEVVPAKSGNTAHLGIRLSFTKRDAKAAQKDFYDTEQFLGVEHIIYVVSE